MGRERRGELTSLQNKGEGEREGGRRREEEEEERAEERSG